jgi:hypothetical protein
MDNSSAPVNLQLLVGQFALILLISAGLGLCYLSLDSHTWLGSLLLLIWILLFITLGIWTRTNPKPAFAISLMLYLVTVIIKDIVWGGEYLLPFLFHIYFIGSMAMGMKAFQKK